MDTQVIKVPDIGDFEGVDVVEVHVAPGDSLAAEDAVVTLESDKATLDVPAPVAGTVLEVFVKVGDQVSEGDRLASVSGADPEAGSNAGSKDRSASGSRAGSDDGSSNRSDRGSPDGSTVGSPEAPAPPPSEVPHASPAVRRLARELGVSLLGVEGSGRKGRIRADDVYGLARQRGAQPAASGAFAMPPAPQVDFAKFGEVEEVPLSRVRQKGVTRLHTSWLHIPHVTQHGEADVTELEAFRKSLKDEAAAREVRLTSMAFLMKACVSALQAYPDFNSSLSAEADRLIRKKYINLGIAVDTEDGLVVPVVHEVDKKGVWALAKELAEVSERARSRKLLPGDVQGATFTISNLGSIGGTAFTPIVNLPEVAILGVSRSAVRPVWDGEAFVPRTMLPLSLSYDHRAIDGAAAARFVTHLAQVLSDTRRLVL